MAAGYYTDTSTIRAVKFADATTASISADTLAAAGKDAYDLINGVCDRLYSVPFDTFSGGGTPPGIIVSISDVITMWRAKRYSTGHSTTTKGPLKDMYDEALALLDRIGKGEVSIPGVSQIASTSRLSSSTQGEHRVFDSIDELDMGQDPDQYDRIIDERS